jgi:excisionase family DNA binding protein
MAIHATTSLDDPFLTVAEVAERLKVNDDTVRRLFAHEPGVVVICFPRRGRRLYRTLRIPTRVFDRVLTRLTQVA